MKEHMDVEVQWFEAHTAVHTSTVVGQSTLHIVKGDVRGLHPVQGALCSQRKENTTYNYFHDIKNLSLLRNTVVNIALTVYNI